MADGKQMVDEFGIYRMIKMKIKSMNFDDECV